MPHQKTQPSSNLGPDQAIDPGPAIGPAEMVIIFAAFLIGMFGCLGVVGLYRKFIIKTPRRSHDD